MHINEDQIIAEVRGYIFHNAPLVINMSALAKTLEVDLSVMIDIFPSPDVLIAKMLCFEKHSFEMALEQYDFAGQSAIDNLIVVGQVIYNRYRDVHPCVFTRLKGYSTVFSENEYFDLLQGIFDFFISNINCGLTQGIFDPEMILKQPNTNFIRRIVSQENETIYKTQHFITFGILFNNYFEDFLQNNLSREAWSYFIARKRFVESLDFGR